MMDKWDRRILEIAEKVATWSKDPVEGVGAVIVSPDRKQVSWGFNGLPSRIEDDPDTLGDRDAKDRLMVHAELNAVLNSPVDLTGWTIYCTKFPCCTKNCAQAIIQRNIARVVAPAIDPYSRWGQDQTAAYDLLSRADVTIMTYQPDNKEHTHEV